MAQQTLEDIADSFSILHDGYIVAWSSDRELLTLKVECEHLACRIKKHYSSFYVELGEIELIEFHPWMHPTSPPAGVFKDLPDIFKEILQVNATEIQDNTVVLTCLQNSEKSDFYGGKLLLCARQIRLFDEDMNPITINELETIAVGYWNDCLKETEAMAIEREENRAARKKENDSRKEAMIALFKKNRNLK